MEEKVIYTCVIDKYYFKVYYKYFTIHEQLDHSDQIVGRETSTPLTAPLKCIAFAKRHGIEEIIKINIGGVWI